jgi:hypothetical protein
VSARRVNNGMVLRVPDDVRRSSKIRSSSISTIFSKSFLVCAFCMDNLPVLSGLQGIRYLMGYLRVRLILLRVLPIQKDRCNTSTTH